LRILLLSLGVVVFPGIARAADAPPAPDTGHYSVATLFNQANAYARDGKIGMAVLDYERARLLAPADGDIATNLRILRQKNNLPEDPESDLATVFALDPTVVAWLGCAGLLLIGIAVTVGLLQRKRRLLWSAMAACGVLMVLLEAGNAAQVWPRLHDAVVIADDVPARLSPVSVGEPRFQLHEGERVRLRGGHAGFLLVERASGDVGWVASDGVEAILPSPAHGN
jgi:hypothetical protein